MLIEVILVYTTVTFVTGTNVDYVFSVQYRDMGKLELH